MSGVIAEKISHSEANFQVTLRFAVRQGSIALSHNVSHHAVHVKFI